MADNNLSFKVTAKADGEEVVDLAKNIKKLKEEAAEPIKVKLGVDDAQKELDELTKESVELQRQLKQLKQYGGVQVHGDEIEKLTKEIEKIDKRRLELYAIIDDAEIKSAQREVDDLKGEKAEVDVNVNDSEIGNAKKEIDDLKGEKVQVDVDVDDSQIKNAKKEIDDLGDSLQSSLGSTESAVTGVISGMAGKSIWDTIYGTSKRAETNKILLKNMADSSVAYDDLYKTIDSTTDQSLISMQSLIPALNGIQSATASTGSTINNITPGVAQFGQYVLALTGSEAKAESAMFDLSKGIKGLYASLDQYGITEDALMRTGLWSGKEDDVEGYIAAVNEVTGSTDELMGSTQGLEALMGKAFSRGGKRIGEDLLPQVKNLLTGFMQLDTATDGWLSTGLLLAGGALTGITSFLSMAGQAINGAKMLREAYAVLIPAQYAEGTAGWFSIGWIVLAIALGIALGLALVYLYNNSEEFRNAVNWLGQSIQWLVSTAFQELLNLLNFVQNLGQQVLASVGVTGNDITNTIVGVIAFIATLPARLAVIFINTIANLLGFKGQFVQTMIALATNSVTGFMSYISSLPGRFRSELFKMLGYARDFLVQLPATLKNAAINVVKSWIFGTGEHSPGDMYDAFTGELEAMTTIVPKYGNPLSSNIGKMGSEMVDAFGEPELGYSFNGQYDFINGSLTGSNGNDNRNITLNIEVGSVDNEDRINQIVDAVKRELIWNNTTAGRII